MWERYVVAAMFLTLIPSMFFITFMFGLVIFLVYRREYHYLTYHSLLAALWQLCFWTIHGIFTFLSRHVGTHNPSFVFSPAQWGHLSQTGQLVMAILLASIVLNFLIALWGALLTLNGYKVRLPLLSAICDKMMPR